MTTAEALGESTCGTTTPDITVIDLTNGQVDPPNGSYDHSTCRNSFIVQGNITDSLQVHYAYATYNGPITTPQNYGCNAMWSKVSLWEKSGSSWVKIADSPTAYGSQFGSICLAPRATINTPNTGTYKVMGQAGVIFTYEPVIVGAVNSKLE